MSGYLKKKLMEQIVGNGNNGELSLREIKQAFKKFRLGNKDLFPVCNELERDGLLKRGGKTKSIKFKIKAKLRL